MLGFWLRHSGTKRDRSGNYTKGASGLRMDTGVWVSVRALWGQQQYPPILLPRYRVGGAAGPLPRWLRHSPRTAAFFPVHLCGTGALHSRHHRGAPLRSSPRRRHVEVPSLPSCMPHPRPTSKVSLTTASSPVARAAAARRSTTRPFLRWAPATRRTSSRPPPCSSRSTPTSSSTKCRPGPLHSPQTVPCSSPARSPLTRLRPCSPSRAPTTDTWHVMLARKMRTAIMRRGEAPTCTGQPERQRRLPTTASMCDATTTLTCAWRAKAARTSSLAAFSSVPSARPATSTTRPDCRSSTSFPSRDLQTCHRGIVCGAWAHPHHVPSRHLPGQLGEALQAHRQAGQFRRRRGPCRLAPEPSRPGMRPHQERPGYSGLPGHPRQVHSILHSQGLLQRLAADLPRAHTHRGECHSTCRRPRAAGLTQVHSLAHVLAALPVRDGQTAMDEPLLAVESLHSLQQPIPNVEDMPWAIIDKARNIDPDIYQRSFYLIRQAYPLCTVTCRDPPLS